MSKFEESFQKAMAAADPKRSQALVTSRTGSFGHERMIVKRVPTSPTGESSAHWWLNRQTDNRWSIYEGDLGPGTYAFVGGKWVNVKKIDPSVLPHV
jgi:hypothetical protein